MCEMLKTSYNLGWREYYLSGIVCLFKFKLKKGDLVYHDFFLSDSLVAGAPTL